VSQSTVNRRLTPQTAPRMTHHRRRRELVANDDFAAFTRRVITAHGRRIAAGDIEGLAELHALAEHLDTITCHAVTGLRAASYSWADIGARLGMTRQAAHQRFGRQGNDR
jgi:hypothetical protein